MPDTNAKKLESTKQNGINKKHSFFGWEINNKTKDFLDFRYNTQEEIDKLNEEMAITDDLDEIIKQTNETENEENMNNNNEWSLIQNDESDSEELPHTDNKPLDSNDIDQYKDKNDSIEWEVIENLDDKQERDNNKEAKSDIDENTSWDSAKFFDPFEVDLEEDNEDDENDEDTEEDEYTKDEDDANTEISNEWDQNNKEKVSSKDNATWKVVNDEENWFEQWESVENTESEDEEEYKPSAEELFEREPEFFADDELSQQFMYLTQNVRGIFKLESKDDEQSPYFKILWWKTKDSTLEYLFYLIEEKDEPIDLYIKKVETNQENWEENEHLVQFSYNEDKELNVLVDEIILYEKVNKLNSENIGYNDTKAILEKFTFLTENHYNKLKSELDKINEEKKKKKQLQQIFKGF